MPPFEVRIETDRVVMIWVFVQIIDPLAETAIENEGEANDGKHHAESKNVGYTSFPEICRSILVQANDEPLSSGLKVDL